MRLHRDERGQTILLVALSLPVLIGFIGIATDVGILFKDKRTMQTAADAAAIAGALNYNNGATAWKAAARAAATANGFTDTSNGIVVTTPDTPQWPTSNYNGKPGYVEVTITKPESTIFLALFGRPLRHRPRPRRHQQRPRSTPRPVSTGIATPGSPPSHWPRAPMVAGIMQSDPPHPVVS